MCLDDPLEVFCKWPGHLWKQFKNSLIGGMKNFIPQKPFSSKQRLPWVYKAIRKLIQARNKHDKVYVKWHRSKSSGLREKLCTIRHKLQTQMRQAYWAYMEIIIDFSSPIKRPDDRATKQKRFRLFIRGLRKYSSGVSPLRSEHGEGEIHTSQLRKKLRYWISNSLHPKTSWAFARQRPQSPPYYARYMHQ